MAEASNKTRDNLRCWGCDKAPPRKPCKQGGIATLNPGWVVKPFEHEHDRICEVWCPDCAAMTGFGCVEERER